VDVSMDCPVFWIPPIISGTGKATDFKFGQYIHRVHPNKSPLKILENVGKSSRGCSQGLPKIFRAPIHRAHRAVIFEIAQLSCSLDLSVPTLRRFCRLKSRIL